MVNAPQVCANVYVRHKAHNTTTHVESHQSLTQAEQTTSALSQQLQQSQQALHDCQARLEDVTKNLTMAEASSKDMKQRLVQFNELRTTQEAEQTAEKIAIAVNPLMQRIKDLETQLAANRETNEQICAAWELMTGEPYGTPTTMLAATPTLVDHDESNYSSASTPEECEFMEHRIS